ncbi:MAG: hypothetical protein WBD22_00835 [Pyrinomonadaceae bacterium]
MKRIKNSLIAIAGISLLTGAVTFFMPHLTQGQGGDVVGPTKPVKVVNTTDEPVPVRDVDNVRQPFHKTTNLGLADGQDFILETIFTVPVGKQLIIETVSARIELPTADIPHIVRVSTDPVDGSGGFHDILVLKQGERGTNSVFGGTHYIRAYADAGTRIKVTLVRSSSTDRADASINVSGYLVDVP